MHTLGEAKLLRIFIGEKDRCEGKPLYEHIVQQAREQGLAGATVLRGIEGFGASSLLHTSRLLRLSEDLPLVIEIVDKEDRIQPFVEILHTIFDRAKCGGLMTMERVEVVAYKPE
jgi:PII-like signaling protein